MHDNKSMAWEECCCSRILAACVVLVQSIDSS